MMSGRGVGLTWATYAALALLFPSVVPLNPLVIRGNMIYDSVTQERVFLRGVTYNPVPQLSGAPAGTDFFGEAHDHIWIPALDTMVEMNINAVRLYDIDVTVNHAPFMKACESRGSECEPRHLFLPPPLPSLHSGLTTRCVHLSSRCCCYCYYCYYYCCCCCRCCLTSTTAQSTCRSP